MVRHLDVVFDYKDQRQIDLMHKIATMKDADDNELFRLHLVPYKTVDRRMLGLIWEGEVDPTTLDQLGEGSLVKRDKNVRLCLYLNYLEFDPHILEPLFLGFGNIVNWLDNSIPNGCKLVRI